MTKMTDDQLLNQLETLERQATGFYGGEIAAEQRVAMDYYLGKPFGTEEEGRSQVVSSDVWDVVEGLTPLVLKPFVSSDDVVKFNPVGPEDEEAAEQETDYINYVITQKNDNFEQLVAWVKTGLLQKNGVVKWYWEKSRRTEIERYYDVPDDVFALLLQEEGIEVTEHTERVVEVMTPQGPMQETVHDVTLRVSKETGEARYAVVPPEEFIISRDASRVNPQHASLVEHRKRVTISELREMGYDVEDDINDGATEDPAMSQQYLARRESDETEMFQQEWMDPSMREVVFREAYVRIDYDGDGIAELRKICRVGREILANEETEEIPFAAWTPYQQPFKFYGRCPADETTELQLIKSTILRQTMDNIYTINNNRVYVSDRVNLDDLLDNQIAGVVRVPGTQGIQNDVKQAEITPIGQVTMPMIEYFDSAKENRTGFTRYNQGTDANSLNKTATGVRIIAEAGNNRVDIIARAFAETGLKQLMLGIHGLCRRHSTKAETVRLRGKWVNVDPRGWKTRYDMTVSVGLGTADQQMKMQGAQLLMQAQMNLLPAGIVNPDNLLHAASKLVEAVGYKNPEAWFSKPQPQQPSDPTKDPQFMLEAEKVKNDRMRVEIEAKKASAEIGEKRIKALSEVVKVQREGAQLQHSQQMERDQFSHQVSESQRQAEIEAKPEQNLEEIKQGQEATLQALQQIGEGLMQMQQLLARLLEDSNKPRTLRAQKMPDGSWTGIRETQKEAE